MSFRAVTETVVHFESFRNIDLFHQGIYFLRTSLYYQKDQNCLYAQPYTIFNPKLSLGNQGNPQTLTKRKKRNLDHHNIIPATIEKNLFTFNTRAFMIRYCEEEVELNDIGHFRVELDLDETSPIHIEFFMEVELMFSDLLNQGGPDKFQQSNNLKDIEGNVEFKCVSVQKFKIRKLCEGIFDFVPVIFDEQHFCVALATIHSSLLDFRFRTKPLQPFSRAEYQKSLLQQDQNKGNQSTKKSKPQKKDDDRKPNNIAEYLFSNEKGEMGEDVDHTEVDMIYNGYMQTLIQSYEKLKGKYNSFATKCLSERQKRESGLILVAPNLIMPSEKDYSDSDNIKLDEEHKNIKNIRGPASEINQVRMGGRLGAKLEKAQKKGQDDELMRNQGFRGEEESVLDDDEVVADDEQQFSKNKNPPKNMIEREPEREPDYSGIEGNISQSQILKEQPLGQKHIHHSNIQPVSKQGNKKNLEIEDEALYNVSHEVSLNISETNDSMLEMKKVTAIPLLKNSDQFKSKTNKEKSENGSHGTNNLNLQFSQRIQSNDPYMIAFQLIQDINLVSAQVFQLWHKVIEIITINPKFVCEFLRIQYEEKMRESWGEHIYRTIIETQDFAYPNEENVGEIHKQIAQKRRNGPNGTLISSNFEVFNVIEIGSQSLQNALGTQGTINEAQKVIANHVQVNANAVSNQALQKAMNDLQPILFEECYVKSIQKIKSMQAEASQTAFNEYNYKGVHLFVMVHGFQGNACDMRLLKNNIAMLFPEAMFLCSSANEDHTEGDISEMGVRLAQEVNSYINQYCPGSSLGKISFIAHSLGGLITRASLPYLEEHMDKMYNFFTLSSPHLGYMYNSSKIIDAGMWFLKTWRKSKCLQQLRMNDQSNLEECFLHKLSEMKGLNWFKHIVLVSSYQDSYAPFDSARIQISKKAENDSKSGGIYIKMARNILQNLPIDVLYRIDVDFRIAEKNLDSLIGRTAHIQFLECQHVMKMIIYRFKEFFC